MPVVFAAAVSLLSAHGAFLRGPITVKNDKGEVVFALDQGKELSVGIADLERAQDQHLQTAHPR